MAFFTQFIRNSGMSDDLFIFREIQSLETSSQVVMDRKEFVGRNFADKNELNQVIASPS